MARKLPGIVQNSLSEANKQNVSETPPPKRPSNGSSNEALDLHETSAAKESELNLGSVRLALHGRLSGRALAELLELCFERSHSAVNFLRHFRLQPLSLTEDCANPLHCANPFQAALQDAKKESSRAGKLKYRFQTKFLRFRVQLEVLFVDMRLTARRYFRYLFPNSTRGQEP